MALINVGILRGGPSHEYEISLKTGSSILKNLLGDKYRAHDIYIDREGVWHHAGVPVNPEEILPKMDVVFNALHGNYGEDGNIQKILEENGVPYTGSDALGSALGMNKALAKKIFTQNNIKTPYHKILSSNENIHDQAFEIFRSFPMPAVIKPVSGGSSIGITIAKDFDSLVLGMTQAFDYDTEIMIEEYIKGKEATIGVIENFRNTPLYTLPPVEIRPKDGRFFDYKAKYEGESEEIVPGNFTNEEKEIIQALAKQAHEVLGLRHYSRSDFIISPKRGIYILETNTLPGFTEQSTWPKALKAVGAELHHFFDHLLELALKQKNS